MSIHRIERFESGFKIGGAILASAAVSGWNREAARQSAVRDQLARNAVVAAAARAAVDRQEVARLRADLHEARVLVARGQTRVDALEAACDRRRAPAARIPAPVTETGEQSLRTALIWARAEVASLRDEADDLEDELADRAV